MKRRSFLTFMGMAAVGFAAPRVLVEGSLNPPVPPPVLTPSVTEYEFFFASPVQAHNYKQMGFNLRAFDREHPPWDLSFPRYETDRRRVGRSIRKARRKAALCRSSN